jgi:hypothetical protein
MTFEGAGTRKFSVIRYIITEMDVHERQAVGRRMAESAAETRHTIVLLDIGALLQLVLLVWMSYFPRHDITERRTVNLAQMMRYIVADLRLGLQG